MEMTGGAGKGMGEKGRESQRGRNEKREERGWNDGEDARVMPYQLSSPCCLAFLFFSRNMECRSAMGLSFSNAQSYPNTVTPSRRGVLFLDFFLPSRAQGFLIRQEQEAHTANPSISIPAFIPALA